jgi:pyruvate formate lyase activating enzyme
MKLQLAGFIDLSTMEWPRRLAAVVPFQGCDFRCPWCPNVDGIESGGGTTTELREVTKHIKEFIPTINSVMAAGGEPLLQPKACLSLLKRAKKLKLGCGIKTNGANPKHLKRALPYLDFIAIVIEAPFIDPELYGKMIGRQATEDFIQKIKESLRIAIGSEAEVEARVTVVPTLNDGKDTIEEIALEVTGVDHLRLQQFRNVRTLDPGFQELPIPSRRSLIKLARVAKRKGVGDVSVFTVEQGLCAI